jgi:hypothetical protein
MSKNTKESIQIYQANVDASGRNIPVLKIAIICLAIVSIIAVVLVVIREIKKTSKGPKSNPSSMVFYDPKNKGDTLYVNQYLDVGDYLQNGNYTARLGGKYNRLVLSNGAAAGGYDYWARTEVGNKLFMQPDGNLVIVDKDGINCWAMFTTAPPNAPVVNFDPTDKYTRMVLQSDGNIIMYNNKNQQSWPSKTG